MTSFGSRISSGCDHYDSLTDCLLSSLVHNAPRTGNILVSTQGDVQPADVETLTIRDYALNPLCDVFFSYATSLTYFYEHELGFVSQTAIHAVAELSIPGSGNRRLCPVPLPWLYWPSSKRRAALQIFISDDAVNRCYEIRVRIESRIEKRQGHSLARIFRVCI